MAQKEGSYLKRIVKEFGDVQNELVKLYNSRVDLYKQDDYYLWKFSLAGPQGSPYEGGKFDLEMTIPKLYPNKPPELIFKTKIYHPNVMTETGEVCPLMFQKDWKPTKKIMDIVNIIMSMMSSPHLEAPVEPGIAKECEGDAHVYKQKAKEFTKKHAMGN